MGFFEGFLGRGLDQSPYHKHVQYSVVTKSDKVCAWLLFLYLSVAYYIVNRLGVFSIFIPVVSWKGTPGWACWWQILNLLDRRPSNLSAWQHPAMIYSITKLLPLQLAYRRILATHIIESPMFPLFGSLDDQCYLHCGDGSKHRGRFGSAGVVSKAPRLQSCFMPKTDLLQPQ